MCERGYVCVCACIHVCDKRVRGSMRACERSVCERERVCMRMGVCKRVCG